MTSRHPLQPKLFCDPVNPGKVSSKATFYFCTSISLSGIRWSILLGTGHLSLSTSIMSDIMNV